MYAPVYGTTAYRSTHSKAREKAVYIPITCRAKACGCLDAYDCCCVHAENILATVHQLTCTLA